MSCLARALFLFERKQIAGGQLSFVSCCVFEETVHGFLPQTDVCKTLVKAVVEGTEVSPVIEGITEVSNATLRELIKQEEIRVLAVVA